MNAYALQIEDPVFHPRYGFGIVKSLTRRDPAHPLQETVSSLAPDYYDIQLLQGGSLLVPVDRAESVGLRLLTNGLKDITECLCSPAQHLPENSRERAAELHARGESPEPAALVRAVRDLVGQSRNRSLSNSEKTWLDKSCERLSTEAALVSNISVAQARTAIWEVVRKLRES